ncbi:hypothetical protein OAA53_00260 [Salibacteraceae bacterium]|nr:hypothetical protein [Flavobacteriales bacterium]MDB9701141.1 hypothetical protein [Salibacteraceae bacterium]
MHSSKWIYLVLALTGFTQISWAQTIEQEPIEIDKVSKSIYLKTNPLSVLQGPVPYFTGELRLGFEFIGSDRFTYQASASYVFLSPLLNVLANNTPAAFGGAIQMPGYRFQGQVRYYYLKFYNKKKLSKVFLPTGLYTAIHSSYSNAYFRDKNAPIERIEFTQLSFDLLGGMQVMYNDVFGIDFFAGMGYKNNVITYYDYRGRKEIWDADMVNLGSYYSSPIKLTIGMNLTFGLL